MPAAASASPTDADLERLRYALGREDIELDAPLFAPDSLSWRLHRESALLLGGGRALLMQVAHPLVAEGVARFSNFRKDPLARLWRTLELTLTISFASAAEAIAAVRTIERAHKRVHGELEQRVGPFPAGIHYDASDPDLMFWVHATLVDSAIVVYDRFVAPLGRTERRAYYEESKITARVMGIPESHLPPTYAGFQRYLRTMLRDHTLTVGSAGREVAHAVLYPERPPGLSQLLLPARLLTCDLLPAELRRQFQLPSVPLVAGAATLLATASRALLPWIPQRLRDMPYSRVGNR